MRRSRHLAVALVAVGAILGSALPATASGGPAPDVSATGEAPPPTAPAARGAVASRAAVGQTTTYTDDAGRTVFRVDDGFDLDQYLYRGPLTFSFDIDRSYGPVDEHGHPAPGNLLYGKSMLLTMRAWDVDEAQGEVDDVRFNGNLLVPGQLSGANNQWATDTFDVFASWLHLPTPDNPRGTNTVQIDVDRNNGGWAVEIDWAELRPYVPHSSVRPVVLAHGITDNGAGAARSGMWRFDDYLQETVPGLRNRTSSPPMTLNGSIADNVAILADAVDDLVDDEPTNQVDVVAHSMGGLDARQYAFDNPGRVRNLVMVGTPNGGAELAVALCALRMNKKFPTSVVGWLARDAAPEFGDCDGPDNGLYQLLPAYVRDVFNRQVPDRPGVNYQTIAGRKGGPGSVITDGFGPGILGEDDGTVSVASVRWLSVADDEHPGLHFSVHPTVDRDHMGLIHQRDGKAPSRSRRRRARSPTTRWTSARSRTPSTGRRPRTRSPRVGPWLPRPLRARRLVSVQPPWSRPGRASSSRWTSLLVSTRVSLSSPTRDWTCGSTSLSSSRRTYSASPPSARPSTAPPSSRCTIPPTSRSRPRRC
ncbi:MAG: alpha/beta fold hydrolase [Cellulomonas sp.]|uniref:alpha/beta fold hydrolase n=1 Tax=Cellulomonas sp. TaxID=40001 RepID=UPI002585EDE0|nr:alpha/beta fold hydrolase [Cellulomonas sp.]MCR6704786.1 alpha/beta fold hydrolase [Cellulomonas sp.]